MAQEQPSQLRVQFLDGGFSLGVPRRNSDYDHDQRVQRYQDADPKSEDIHTRLTACR